MADLDEDWVGPTGHASEVDRSESTIRSLDLHVPAAGAVADRPLVVAVGQLYGHVQTGGDAAHRGLRERLDERVARLR